LPQVRPGGDSIVFLRGRWKLDENTPGTPAAVPQYREASAIAGFTASSDRYRYAQGVIDPNVATATLIGDEMTALGAEATTRPVHVLSGINSIQRTVRADVKFAPWDWGSSVMPRRVYFLIADTGASRDLNNNPDAGGVWEFRMLADA